MTTVPHIPPAVLRLVQELVFGRWRAAGEELYREVAKLLEVGAGQEILVAGCGDGTSSAWLAERTGAAVTGVDPDAERIEEADERARELLESGTPLPLAFQQAALDDLPHETAVFDAVVAGVVKPMGAVVLLQLTWSSELSAEARALLVERLGMRPLLLVEWKQMLRDAGIVDLQVQDWTDEADEAADGETPQLTWQQKVQLVGATWRRRGFREALDALSREEALLRELSRERAVGFQVIRGVKWPHARGA